MPVAPDDQQAANLFACHSLCRPLRLSADACVVYSTAHLAASNLACAALQWHIKPSPAAVAGLSFNGNSANSLCLQVQRAVTLWQQLLDGRFRLLRRWCRFVAQSGPHMISEDTWRQVSARSRLDMHGSHATVRDTRHCRSSHDHCADSSPWHEFQFVLYGATHAAIA